MKNPKMMMGLVALLLAGAGAFASISQPQQTAYYEQTIGDKESCTALSVSVECEPGIPTCERPTPDGNRQLYQDPDCQQPLEEDTGF